jgi:urease accessory protein UreE
MKEREQVLIRLKDGDVLRHRDAEVIRDGEWLVVYLEDKKVYRFSSDFIAYYIVSPVEVKNLDD